MVAREAANSGSLVTRDTVAPVPVTGRRYRRRERYTRRTMSRALVASAFGVAAVLAYTIPYAMAAQEGYAQNETKIELQQLNRDNEDLRTELARLRNPDRIAAYAVHSGMVMRQSAQFITLRDEGRAAPPRKSLLARLMPFGLH